MENQRLGARGGFSRGIQVSEAALGSAGHLGSSQRRPCGQMSSQPGLRLDLEVWAARSGLVDRAQFRRPPSCIHLPKDVTCLTTVYVILDPASGPLMSSYQQCQGLQGQAGKARP